MTSGERGAAKSRIAFGQLAAYGAGGIIPIALFNVAGILLGLVGNISLGLSAFWLGVILVVPHLLDALVDPVIGHLSDNTRTRWGRRRPYLLAGGLLVSVFFVAMWWIPKSEQVRQWFPSDAGYQGFQLGYILFFLTLFFGSVTLFEIPHGALGMEMASDPQQRTRLFSAKNFVGNAFAMSTPWLLVLANLEFFKGPLGNEADGMRYVSMLIAALVVPLSFWSFFALKEPGFEQAARQPRRPLWPDLKHCIRNLDFLTLTLAVFTLALGFNFVQLLGSYIPIYYIHQGDKAQGAVLLGVNGTAWAVAGMLAVFPLDWIRPRLGNRATLAVAILLVAIAQLAKIVCYDPGHPYLILIPTILLSCGMFFFFTLGASMVGDVCDADELETGTRSEGAFYAVYWWFIKTGTALASLISGALIAVTLFDETQVIKVDRLQASIRDMRTLVEERARQQANLEQSDVESKLQQARAHSVALRTYLQDKLARGHENADHYRELVDVSREIELALARMSDLAPHRELQAELASVSGALPALHEQSPRTLSLMRWIEIGLPLAASLLSLVLVLCYRLDETRTRELKATLAQRRASAPPRRRRQSQRAAPVDTR